MTTFVLVHGGYHGGWCWELLIAELEARGHATIAPDLPCDDPDAGNLTAEVFFRDGEIDAAVMSGGLQGAAAVYRLLTWTSGRFWLVPKEPSHKKSLGLPFEQILLEGLRRLDESRRGPLSQSMRGLAEPPPFFPSRES